MALLHSDRLTLARCTPADARTLRRLWSDPQVRRYAWDGREVTDEDVARVLAQSEALASRGLGHWLARRRTGDTPVVGAGGLRPRDGGSGVELLYALVPAHWGQGLATELARALVEHGFGALGLTELWAEVDEANQASVRVLQRLGFTLESSRPGTLGELLVWRRAR